MFESPRESNIIGIIAERFPSRPDLTFLGIGDDAAQLRGTWDLVTTDAFVAHVHFDLAFMSWADVGFRALAANLSDIAAMGGEPGPLTLALGLPVDTKREDVEALADGLQACIRAHDADNVWLVGGDVVRTATPFLSVTLLGRSLGAGPIGRRGARAGDRLAVFQPLGGSAAGLRLLQTGGGEPYPNLIRRFRRPLADVALGAHLALAEGLTACLDLSDGLAIDAPRMLRSDLGLEVDVGRIPQPDGLHEAATSLDLDPLELVVAGGEDYTLCVALAVTSLDEVSAIAAACDRQMHLIGEFVDKPGVRFWVDGQQVSFDHAAFSHFPTGSDRIS